MFARTVFAIMFLCSIAAIPALAQDEALVSFSGRVLADRRPVDWTVEIRLEREDASLITTAYTRGTDYFKFHQVFLRRNESSYLVIKEPGYRELKYAFDFFDLRQDPISGMYYRANIIILERRSLEKISPRDSLELIRDDSVI